MLKKLNNHCARLRSSLTFTNDTCLRYLINCKTLDQLKQIQTQIFMADLHQTRPTINKLMAFCADPSLPRNLAYAEKVFDFAQQPTLFAYNVLIKAYVKRGCYGRAIELFDRLRKEKYVSPDSFTYPFVFKAIGCLGRAWEGKKVHGFVVKSGVDFDVYVCNSLMDMYGLFGQLFCVDKMFDEMPLKDSVSWSVAISAYVRCRRFSDAIGVFRRLQSDGIARPNEAAIVSILSACAALRDLQLGEEIHDLVREEIGFTNRIIVGLLDMYVKCGCLRVAREIFDGILIKDVVSLTCMISGYMNNGDIDEARELFKRNPIEDVVLWTAMINGYVQHNHFDEAIALFQDMQRRGIEADMFTLVSLLTGCSQYGALDQGKWIHGYINERGIEITAVVGTSLIQMYAKCGMIGKSLEVFNGMREKDAAVWTSIICGLAMNNQTHKALSLFAEMKGVGIDPDDITFIGVLTACSHAGLVEEGREFFRSMIEVYKIEPKVEHYGCLIDLFGRAGLLEEAEELLEKIPNDNSDILVPIYGALLSACCTYHNVEMGERMARRLADITSRDSSAHTLLANIYGSAERWEDMKRVRGNMKFCGVRKLPGCSSIEINGVAHEFVVGDAREKS